MSEAENRVVTDTVKQRFLVKAWNLSAAEWRCLMTSLWFIAVLRLSLRWLPWTMVRQRVDRWARVDRRRSGESVERIVWAVKAASRRVPGGGNCLVRALATKIMLGRHGHESQLHIGVVRDDQSPFSAHAWIEYQGKTVVGATPLDYVTLV